MTVHIVSCILLFGVMRMKKALKVTSALCVLVAAAAVIFGFVAMNAGSHSFMLGYSIFRMFERGTFMGVLGNIIVMLFIVVSFGAAGIFGFFGKTKNAFIWSIITSGLAILSLIIVIIGKRCTLGDVIITAIPLAQLFCVYKSTE